MAAPAHAAEVKPLPKAAAKGGAEPRASHPDKAPQAPGWVSMASGVDGASTLVPSVQIGEGASPRAIAYEKSGRWFTAEEHFLRAKERTDAGSSAFRHPRSELTAPLPKRW